MHSKNRESNLSSAKRLLPKKEKELTQYESTATPNLFNLMSTQLENDPLNSYDEGYFQHSLPNLYRSILKRFRSITRSFVNFNLLFGAIFSIELTLFLFFLPFLSRSAILAFALGGLLLTCFSYVVLLFYFQAKKPEQLLELKEQFLHSCRQSIPTPQGIAQHHLSIAEALSKLSSYLQDYEWNFYKVPSILQFILPLLSRFSAFCYWEDVFKMKQLLLLSAVEEHLKQIRATPTDLEVHASLANTYVTLSKLHRQPFFGNRHPRAGRINQLQPIFDEKSKNFSRLAIEEFTILSHYAPNDPWVHEQLALGYCDLDMPTEEIKEVEFLLKLRPQDKEIFFRLGILYFQQGMNAKGLQIYETLKQANFKKAEELISTYGQGFFKNSQS